MTPPPLSLPRPPVPQELQRELVQARRRQESQDPSPAPTPADGLSQASRASSNVSLHEAAPVVQVAAPVEPDRQVLIERIVRLQRQVRAVWPSGR